MVTFLSSVLDKPQTISKVFYRDLCFLSRNASKTSDLASWFVVVGFILAFLDLKFKFHFFFPRDRYLSVAVTISDRQNIRKMPSHLSIWFFRGSGLCIKVNNTKWFWRRSEFYFQPLIGRDAFCCSRCAESSLIGRVVCLWILRGKNWKNRKIKLSWKV